MIVMGTSHLAEVYVIRNLSMSYEIQQAAAMMGTGHGAAVCQTGNVNMSVELQQASVTTGTSHQAEECIIRNISVSFGIQQEAAMMGTGHGAAGCRKRKVSMSVELHLAAVTLMETVRPAEACVKRSTTRDETRDNPIQHFSQGSDVSHTKLFCKQIERHGRWMHSCHVQLQYVSKDHNLMCRLLACRGVGVIAWVDGGRECDRSRVVSSENISLCSDIST